MNKEVTKVLKIPLNDGPATTMTLVYVVKMELSERRLLSKSAGQIKKCFEDEDLFPDYD